MRKAINDGRLREREIGKASTQSERNRADAEAANGLGTACTHASEKMFAALGLLGDGAPVSFQTCLDVPNWGVLCALPALLCNGLLKGLDKLGDFKGYYTRFHVLILLAFMALCRIKTIEKLRGSPPGEFGCLLGLDRIPEVRCLRQKIDKLAQNDGARQWAAILAKHWMESQPDACGFLYVDGHISIYNGNATQPPRRYVSRQRLCLRGLSNYWVNDALGQPFFVVEKQIDHGLLQTLRSDIVPRLLADVPNQPTQEELERDPALSRFVIVFDREGYSPAFFKEMWDNHRIACMTYRKNCSDTWPEEWFNEVKANAPDGEIVKMRMAEMGSLVGSGKNAMWMKEIR